MVPLRALVGRRTRHPRLRWVALGWFVVWAPTYAVTWGFRNFLALCDVAVALTCLGIWRGSPLLVSSQTLPSLIVGLLWTADLGGRVVLGRHPFGGTEYMFMESVPLPIRLLSFFHVALPLVQLRLLAVDGYDRRALPVQAALTFVLVAASRALGPIEKNLNYAFKIPVVGRSFEPAPLHVVLVSLGIVALVYLPTHALFVRLFKRAR